LQPGQAVQIATASNGATSVVFNESAKAPGNHSSTFRNTSAAEGMQVIGQFYTTENYVAGNAMHDSFGIYFSEDFSNDVTQEDAVKPFNFTENFGVVNGDEILSIERRALPQENEEIQLFSNNYSSQDYTLTLEVTGFDESTAYFNDIYMGTTIPLNEGMNTLNILVEQGTQASMVNNRFYISFDSNSLSTKGEEHFSLSIYPNPTEDGNFNIISSELKGQHVRLTVTDVLGREVIRKHLTFNGNSLQVETNEKLNSGVYLITITQGGNSQTLRLIKR
jgi:hypothetical protein